MNDGEIFKVICIYFKDSGAFYTEGTYLLTKEKKRRNNLIYPRDIGKWLRENKALPGLMGGTWDGCFICEVEGHYAELIFPI